MRFDLRLLDETASFHMEWMSFPCRLCNTWFVVQLPGIGKVEVDGAADKRFSSPFAGCACLFLLFGG